MNGRAKQENERIVKPVAVAVEGLDYYRTLLSQIKDDSQLQEVQLWDFSGPDFSDLKRWLALFVTLDGFRDKVRAIGVIRDAEEDASNMFRSIAQTLENVGLTAPPRPMEITASKPATGILIMPHNRPSGCLEHAMIEARRPDAPLHCAEEYLQCVGIGQRNENWQAKVKVHSLIAAGRNPACALSQSVPTHPLNPLESEYSAHQWLPFPRYCPVSRAVAAWGI